MSLFKNSKDKPFSKQILDLYGQLDKLCQSHRGSCCFILGCDPESKQFVTLGVGPRDEAVRMFAQFMMSAETADLAMDAMATAAVQMDAKFNKEFVEKHAAGVSPSYQPNAEG